MLIGDKVQGITRNTLVCGSGRYPYAIVMSVNPLILVSKHTDMRWNTLDKDRLTVIGHVSLYRQLRCLRRLSLKERLRFFATKLGYRV